MQSVFVGLESSGIGRSACVPMSEHRRLSHALPVLRFRRGPATPAGRTDGGLARSLPARSRYRPAAGSSGADGDRREARRRRDGLLYRPHPGGERGPPGLSHPGPDDRTADQCRRSRRAGTGGGQARAAGRAQCPAHRAGGRCGGAGAAERDAEHLRASENASGQGYRLARAVRAGRGDAEDRACAARYRRGAVEGRQGPGQLHRTAGGCRPAPWSRPAPSPARWCRPGR